MTESERDEALQRIDKTVTELAIVVKGYDGFKGIAALVSEHAEKIERINACLEPLCDIAPVIKIIEADIADLKGAPGKKALKWFERIGVALLSAAALVLLTLYINGHFAKPTPVQIVPSTEHVK
jgi:hypothetical protein